MIDYNARKPTYIKEEDLRPDQVAKLVNSESFCMIPWIHMHAYPNGNVFSCCLSEMNYSIGNLKNNSMAEIWNSDRYKQLRVNMLADKPSPSCNRCYEQEAAGFFSMRNSSNRNFGQHINLIDQTLPDGTQNEFKLRYYDIRFSNLCNFSCRTCGPIFSSNWYKDAKKLNMSVSHPQVIYPGRHDDDMWDQMLEHIPYLEQIYFAGGEPLIMKEHWAILDELVKRKMFHVRLIYNTNFSETKFKGRDVFEMWKQFDSVSVGASLDDSYERGEYIRKGTVWSEIVENRIRMLEICPKVDFYVSSTLSIMNAWHLPDFHKEWVDLGLIKPGAWNINILQDPGYYRIDALPSNLKEVIKTRYEEHIQWLEPQDPMDRATHGFKSAINFMFAQDNNSRIPEFVRYTNQLDSLRSEKFSAIFPEYTEWYDGIN